MFHNVKNIILSSCSSDEKSDQTFLICFGSFVTFQLNEFEI